MSLIDSSTDLLAMESNPSTNYYFGNYDYDYDPSKFLEEVLKKRVADLEQFAKDKNLDYIAAEDNTLAKEETGENWYSRRRKHRISSGASKRRGNLKKAIREHGGGRSEGIYDYVDPLTFSDIYGSAESADKSDLTEFQQYQQQQPEPTLIRRVATTIFNPTTSTIFTIVAIPIILAASYWLFVVNGPTPVVKARIEEVPIEDSGDEFNLADFAYNILKAYFIPVVQQADD